MTPGGGGGGGSVFFLFFFWGGAQGHNLNKFVEVYQMMLNIPTIKAPDLVVSDKILCFS